MSHFNTPEMIVLSLWFITAGLWLAWSPANKTRREDAAALALWALANIVHGLKYLGRWLVPWAMAPYFGTSAKRLRDNLDELTRQPYYKQIGGESHGKTRTKTRQPTS